MRSPKQVLAILAWSLAFTCAVATQDKPQTPPVEKPASPAAKADEPPIVTHHEVRVGGRALKYTATTGFLPIKSSTGDVEARLFFMAYTLDDVADAAKRPLMFSFNGGPGSSSVWLHLGALGPRRVKMRPDGGMPAAAIRAGGQRCRPGSIAPTWSSSIRSGPGYSRAAKPELGSKFWTLDGDIQSVGEFIRLYLTRYRALGVAAVPGGRELRHDARRGAGGSSDRSRHRVQRHRAGVVDPQLSDRASSTKATICRIALFLPTYAATAWYHKRLAPDLQKDLTTTLDEVEAWAASGPYVEALSRGRSAAGRRAGRPSPVTSRATPGCRSSYVEQSNLRIEIQRFCKELLRRDGLTVGRLDSRFTGLDELRRHERAGVRSQPGGDPSAVHRDVSAVRER